MVKSEDPEIPFRVSTAMQIAATAAQVRAILWIVSIWTTLTASVTLYVVMR